MCSAAATALRPSVGLRYFNVFGPRQDPNGAYAAVIPTLGGVRCCAARPCQHQWRRRDFSRDFCFVANAVQANLLCGARVTSPESQNQVYNVAVGDQTSLNQLYAELATALAAQRPGLQVASAVYGDFRAGDVRHSRADIGKAATLLGYAPTHRFGEGLQEAAHWYAAQTPAA